MLLNNKIKINKIIICLLVRDFFYVLILIFINISEIVYFTVIYI